MALEDVTESEVKKYILQVIAAEDFDGMGKARDFFDGVRSNPELEKFVGITPEWLRGQGFGEEEVAPDQQWRDSILETTKDPFIVAIYVYVSENLYAVDGEDTREGYREDFLVFAEESGVPADAVNYLRKEFPAPAPDLEFEEPWADSGLVVPESLESFESDLTKILKIDLKSFKKATDFLIIEEESVKSVIEEEIRQLSSIEKDATVNSWCYRCWESADKPLKNSWIADRSIFESDVAPEYEQTKSQKFSEFIQKQLVDNPIIQNALCVFILKSLIRSMTYEKSQIQIYDYIKTQFGIKDPKQMLKTYLSMAYDSDPEFKEELIKDLGLEA